MSGEADTNAEQPRDEQCGGANTDRELWREGGGDGNGMSYYEPSIHVTEQGGIGINVGGTVYVKTLREWHALAGGSRSIRQDAHLDPPEDKKRPCNICGRGWPYHENSCSYKCAAQAAEALSARLREAEQELDQVRKEAKNLLFAMHDKVEAAEQREAMLREALKRAANIAEHLFQMIDRDSWRATGGDDGQGHYEGDYRQEQVGVEIRALNIPFDEGGATHTPEETP